MRVSVDPAVAELQKLRPAKLRVYTRDSDEPKAVAIPATRKKWERLGATLEGLDWTRIEALDPRGNISGVVAREEEAAPELDELDIGADTDDRIERMAALIIKAQDHALDRQTAAQKPLVDGMGKLVSVVTEALGAVSQAYRLALAAASSMPSSGGGGGGEAGDGLEKFLQVAGMMMMAKTQSGPQAALGAVKVASEVARARPKNPSKPSPAQPPASGDGPGR